MGLNAHTFHAPVSTCAIETRIFAGGLTLQSTLPNHRTFKMTFKTDLQTTR